jgi:hypothetical protein
LVERVQLETLGEDNPYEVPPGDYIVGEALILDTPSGRILRELYECEIPVGVSSRGRGDVTPDSEGVDVVQDNYEADTWDFVYQPSVTEATPKPVPESSQFSAESVDQLVKESRALVHKASNASLEDLIETRDRVLVGLTQLGKKEYNRAKPELRQVLETCETQLAQSILNREMKVGSQKSSAPVPSESRRSVVNREQIAEVIAELSERTVRAEEKVRRLERLQPGTRPGVRPDVRSVPENSKLQAEYDALLHLSDGFLNRARALKTQNTLLLKEREAAIVLAEGLRARLKRRGTTGTNPTPSVSTFVEAAIKQKPVLTESKSELLKCKTVGEARQKALKILAGRSAELPAARVPEVVETVHVPPGAPSSVSVQKPRTLISLVVERFERHRKAE